jgi:hypothetical protein
MFCHLYAVRPAHIFLLFTTNPHWPDYHALKRVDDVFTEPEMGSIIFETKLSAFMKFIQKKKVFGKVSAFVWRIEYQKRGLPQGHILS